VTEKNPEAEERGISPLRYVTQISISNQVFRLAQQQGKETLNEGEGELLLSSQQWEQ